VRAVSCLGRCDGAPAAAVDDVPVREATPEALAAYVEGLGRSCREPTTSPRAGRPTRTRRREAIRGPRRALGRGERGLRRDPRRARKGGPPGMGGAGFPTGRKWDLVRQGQGSPKYRGLQRRRVRARDLQGPRDPRGAAAPRDRGDALACRVIGASTAIVYIRHEYGREKKRWRSPSTRQGRTAPSRRPASPSPSSRARAATSSARRRRSSRRSRAAAGSRATSRRSRDARPLRKPTLMNNVETFAHVPRILSDGPERGGTRRQRRRGA